MRNNQKQHIKNKFDSLHEDVIRLSGVKEKLKQDIQALVLEREALRDGLPTRIPSLTSDPVKRAGSYVWRHLVDTVEVLLTHYASTEPLKGLLPTLQRPSLKRVITPSVVISKKHIVDVQPILNSVPKPTVRPIEIIRAPSIKHTLLIIDRTFATTLQLSKGKDITTFLEAHPNKYTYYKHIGVLTIKGQITEQEFKVLKTYFNSSADHSALDEVMKRSNERELVGQRR